MFSRRSGTPIRRWAPAPSFVRIRPVRDLEVDDPGVLRDFDWPTEYVAFSIRNNDLRPHDFAGHESLVPRPLVLNPET